jgi:hypothetical protein
MFLIIVARTSFPVCSSVCRSVDSHVPDMYSVPDGVYSPQLYTAIHWTWISILVFSTCIVSVSPYPSTLSEILCHKSWLGKMDFLMTQKINFHYQDNHIECVVCVTTSMAESSNVTMRRLAYGAKSVWCASLTSTVATITITKDLNINNEVMSEYI